MPVDERAISNPFLNLEIDFFLKAFLILFLLFYSVFAFVLYRQIQLMCRALPTQVAPFLRFLAIVHIGFSLAIFFGVAGTF
jgi:hypothetical protein